MAVIIQFFMDCILNIVCRFRYFWRCWAVVPYRQFWACFPYLFLHCMVQYIGFFFFFFNDSRLFCVQSFPLATKKPRVGRIAEIFALYAIWANFCCSCSIISSVSKHLIFVFRTMYSNGNLQSGDLVILNLKAESIMEGSSCPQNTHWSHLRLCC